MTTLSTSDLTIPISTVQESLIREQKLHFINAHRQAFEVEPLYPLDIFQDFITKIDGIDLIEASCKIEADKLQAARFLAFYSQQIERKLPEILTFFRQVENRVDVQINYDLLKRFLGKSFDLSKIPKITIGVDLRPNIADSSLKIHFRIDDYPEKIETALALDGNNSVALRWIALQTVPQIGFDFYLNGRSEIELYCELRDDQFQQPDIQAFLKQTFPPFVLEPLKVSSAFHIGLSKDNAEPVLYYYLKDKKDLLVYFSINDTAQRVHAFYQNQPVLSKMWVGVAQGELQKTKIENIRLYYYKKIIINHQNPGKQ
jgi:LynF/TruF/PatF family peptide O-prenyltransferase